jgi:hypothetical protein
MGLFDDPFGDKAADKNAARFNRGDRLHQMGRGLFSADFGRAENSLLQALLSIQGGTKAALGDVGNIGQASRRGVLDRERGQMADLTQGLTSAGLGNTTAGAGLRRGVVGSTNRALADIDEMIAGLTANLRLGGAQAEAGAHGNLAQFFQNRGLGQADLLGQHANFLLQRQDVGGGLMDLLKAAASAAGAMA